VRRKSPIWKKRLRRLLRKRERSKVIKSKSNLSNKWIDNSEPVMSNSKSSWKIIREKLRLLGSNWSNKRSDSTNSSISKMWIISKRIRLQIWLYCRSSRNFQRT
jgi:hypothetical protein